MQADFVAGVADSGAVFGEGFERVAWNCEVFVGILKGKGERERELTEPCSLDVVFVEEL
jgi:hypothetical protein